MDSHEAKEMMDYAHKINSHLDAAAEMIEGLADEGLKRNIKYELGLAMGAIYVGIMHPIIKQFGELDPDR